MINTARQCEKCESYDRTEQTCKRGYYVVGSIGMFECEMGPPGKRYPLYGTATVTGVPILEARTREDMCGPNARYFKENEASCH